MMEIWEYEEINCIMKKYMKLSKIKKIVVKAADFWMDEIEIDCDIFDDVYLEASTRAVEKRRNLPGFLLSATLECWEKKDFNNTNKHFCYNTYFVLVNAGMHKKSEIFRDNFTRMYGVDLQKESLKGNNDDGNTNINQSESGSFGH